ncbi:MAG: BolA family protein, partial [Lautropia sp.]
MKPTLEQLRERLAAAFPQARIALADDSDRHAGHAGAAGGAGHFSATIVSDRFAGLGRVARHRLVYDCIADWMPHRIHALAVKAYSSAESAEGSTTGS